MSPTRSTTAAAPRQQHHRQPTSTTSTTSQVRAAKDPARVAFVGAGPGDAGLLTVRACEFLAAADAVVIDQVSREELRRRALPRRTSRSSTPATASTASR